MKTIGQRAFNALGLISIAVAAASCSSEDDDAAGEGSVSVLIEPEDVIIDGLQPGDSGEAIRDGWAVTFEKYAVVIGDFDLTFTNDKSIKASDENVFVVDLVKIPGNGLQLWSIPNIKKGNWQLNYATPGAGDGSERHESVSKADYDQMVAEDWTYLISGEMTKSDGMSCPPANLADVGTNMPNGTMSGGNDCYDAPTIAFNFGATAETTFGPCEVDEIPGVAVPADGTVTIAATIHGDHLFFNGFPTGAEGGTQRLAQWLADCDLNLDGTVTREELEKITPSDLPELDTRYQLGGSPIKPLETMYEYLAAQLKTQGHFQGEGDCPVDGVGHDHDHHDDHGGE